MIYTQELLDVTLRSTIRWEKTLEQLKNEIMTYPAVFGSCELCPFVENCGDCPLYMFGEPCELGTYYNLKERDKGGVTTKLIEAVWEMYKALKRTAVYVERKLKESNNGT